MRRNILVKDTFILILKRGHRFLLIFVRQQNQMNQLRQSILMESDMLSSKRRFALFSQPSSISLGDDSPFRQKLPKKGTDGKPITVPRNMLAGSNLSGVGKKSFISYPSSIYHGDKYVDPQKVQRSYEKQFHTRSSLHQIDFKPSSGPKYQAKYPYEHVAQKPQVKQRPQKDDMGRIITKDRNITSNPTVKVQGQFLKYPKYMLDPYERKDILESKEKKISKQKMLPEIFRTMSHGDILFSNSKRTYGLDNYANELLKKKHSFTPSSPVKVNHDTSFKLARRGFGDPIDKFPEYISPSKIQKDEVKKTINKEKPQQQRQKWKNIGNRSLTRPTPSVSLSMINLRRHF